MTLSNEEVAKRLSETMDCQSCGKGFQKWYHPKVEVWAKNRKKFCSKSCAMLYRNKQALLRRETERTLRRETKKRWKEQRLAETVPCRNCLKLISLWNLTLNRQWSRRTFCSTSCAASFRGNNPFFHLQYKRFNESEVAAFGETKSYSEWSRDPRCSITKMSLWHRINRLNLPPEEAITKPPKWSRISDSERERGEAFKVTLKTMLSRSPLFRKEVTL